MGQAGAFGNFPAARMQKIKQQQNGSYRYCAIRYVESRKRPRTMVDLNEIRYGPVHDAVVKITHRTAENQR